MLHADYKHDHRGHRSIDAATRLKVPTDVIRAKCAPYLHHGKPIPRTERTVILISVSSPSSRPNLGYRAVLQVGVQPSSARPVAIRYGAIADQDPSLEIPNQDHRRYRAALATEHGPRRGLQVTVHRDGRRAPLVAQWGGISLARDTTPTVLNDDPPRIWSNRRSELIQRLLADTCELCGSRNQVEVHHTRALKKVGCHGNRARPVWEGAVGKGSDHGHLVGGLTSRHGGFGERPGETDQE